MSGMCITKDIVLTETCVSLLGHEHQPSGNPHNKKRQIITYTEFNSEKTFAVGYKTFLVVCIPTDKPFAVRYNYR